MEREFERVARTVFDIVVGVVCGGEQGGIVFLAM